MTKETSGLEHPIEQSATVTHVFEAADNVYDVVKPAVPLVKGVGSFAVKVARAPFRALNNALAELNSANGTNLKY